MFYIYITFTFYLLIEICSIFPKNLSDELQLQMESGKRVGKKGKESSRDYLLSAGHSYNDNNGEDGGGGGGVGGVGDDGHDDHEGHDSHSVGQHHDMDETGLARPVHPRLNPLVKIISSFSGRERAGWSTLESLAPLPANPLPSPRRSPLSTSSSPSGYLEDLFNTPDSSSEPPVSAFPFSHDYLSAPPISHLSPSINPPMRITSEKSLSPSSSFNFSAFSNNGSSQEVVRSPSRERAQSVPPSPPLTPTSSSSSIPRGGLQGSNSFSRRTPLYINGSGSSMPRGMTKVGSNPLRSRLAVQIPSPLPSSSSSVTSHVLSPQSHASTPTSSSSPIYSLPPVVEQKQFKCKVSRHSLYINYKLTL